jgi:preprotein translocase subunit SecE
MDAFISYLKNVRAEVRKVTWPTRRQATLLTVLVVAVSLLVAAYLGLFDFVLARLLDMFII